MRYIVYDRDERIIGFYDVNDSIELKPEYAKDGTLMNIDIYVNHERIGMVCCCGGRLEKRELKALVEAIKNEEVQS